MPAFETCNNGSIIVLLVSATKLLTSDSSGVFSFYGGSSSGASPMGAAPQMSCQPLELNAGASSARLP